MKLCIIKPDGTSTDIEMLKEQPTLDTIDNELVLFENFSYKIIVRSTELFENAELYIGDFSVSITMNDDTGCFETGRELLFIDCFDLTYISVRVFIDQNTEELYYSKYIRVATTKQTVKQVELMLNEIEESIPNFLEICFSRNYKEAGLAKNDVKSIWGTLNLLNKVIAVYEDNYSNFCNYRKSEVEQVPAIVDSKQMQIVNHESLRWIACNPDYLKKVEGNTGIRIEGENYIPLKVRTYQSRYSYNLYENQIVLSFLQKLLEFVRSQISGFKREIKQLKSIPDKILTQIPNTHDITGQCVYVYYKGVIDKYANVEEALQELFDKYNCMLCCDIVEIDAPPKLTNTFKQIHHYRSCYESIVSWFEASNYSLEHINYLFKLKTLSRIFEYYSLIKLQSALKVLGYEIKETNRIIYDNDEYDEDINNEYIFNNGKYELKLLYEPYIWSRRINEGINLYSTGYNFQKARWNDKWKPDFLIKITGEYDEYYYIIDAKYSTFRNVKSRYMPDLVLKYSAQIASANKFFSQVIGVGAIYPSKDDESINYFKRKNDVAISSRDSLPCYFALSISVGKTVKGQLQNHLNALFEFVDLIEKDYASNANQLFDSINKRVNENDIDEAKNLISEFEGNKYNEENTNEDVSSLTKKNTRVNAVSGKRCFYYAKGMCLEHKTSKCMADSLPCEKYLSKNEKQLLLEEYTCRNFIQYTRKGKVKRVECSVSGNAGCVGPENCKFYLKKKKNQ